MFKILVTNLQGLKSTRSLVFLAALCLFSPLMAYDAHAATNPSGTTVNNMDAGGLNDPILKNYGTILGDTNYAGIWVGMYAYSPTVDVNYNFTNIGTITINKPATDGIFGMSATAINGNHIFTNSGTLTVSGNDSIIGMYAGAINDGNHILTNSGTLTVSGNDTVRGMYASASKDGNHILTNSGTITVSGNKTVYGMSAYANSYGDHKLTNSGTLIVSGNNIVRGMYASTLNNGDHILTNSGTLTVRGNDDVYGMYAEAKDGNHILTNSGTLTVRGNDRVYGMYASARNGNHSLTNSGALTVSGNDGVYGMYASALNGTHSLTNSGALTVSGNDDVYGMYVNGSGTQYLSNTGYISASASARTGRAYEAYGEDSYSVDTWATTLRTWSATDAVFGGDRGDNVSFNNSKLILRPGTAAQGFVLGKEYNVGKQSDGMAAGIQGTVTGTIVAAVAEVPFLKATLSNGANAATATVKLESNVSEETTPGATTMQQAVAQVQTQFNNLSKSLRNALVEIYTQANLVADSGTSGVAAGSGMSPQNTWQVFLSPYGNTIHNSKYDYTGNNVGITAGASYRVNEQFSFGAHLDFNSANYYGELMDMSTKSTSIALGLHAAYNFTPQWYLRAQLTGSINQNDSYYTASPTLSADANYNGEALYAELATGYIWHIARDTTSAHSLTPEIGVSYLGTHTNAYDTEWSMAGIPMTMYTMSYADSYYNAFYGTLSLDWRSQWELKNDASIALLAGLGLRQNLSHGEMESSFRAFGSNFTTKATEDMTTFLADVGVEFRTGDFSVSLNYDGSYGTHQASHGGNVTAKIEF